MNPTTPAPQPACLRGWAEELEQVSVQARRATEGLSGAQLRWQPAEGAWSIGQVFEHLATSNASYLAPMREAVERARQRGHDPRGAWRPSLVGGFMIRSLSPASTRRLPAPRIWRPGPAPRPEVVEAFLGTQASLAELLRAAEEVDLRRTRMHSPVSRLISLNLGDCFQILLVHARRHLEQVRRIRQNPGFPQA